MPTITYTGAGAVFFNGCTEINFSKYYPHKFNVGDACFLKFKAVKGKLEKVVIKQVKIVSNYAIDGTIKFMYLDTFNSLHGEKDLLTQNEAVQTAKQYYEYQIFLTLSAKTICQVTP